MPGISIIICTYNAANRIEPTLHNLQNQKFKKAISWEVILVDNASSDRTGEIAREIWSKDAVTDFSIVKEEKPGLMHARHRGLQEANYPIVSFIDDDNWVEDGWVEKVYDVFEGDQTIGACGGRSKAVFESKAPEWFALFENSFAVGQQAEASGIIDNKKGFLWGAGLSFRKSLWLELQNRGFKNLTVGRQGASVSAGEDTELCYAFRLMGYHLYYHDELSLSHYMPKERMSFSYVERMSEGFGKSNVHLNCYRVFLYPNTFTLHPWWHEWLVAKKSILKELFKSVFSVNRYTVWQAKARKAYWKGYASQTFREKSRLKQYERNLNQIFSAK